MSGTTRAQFLSRGAQGGLALVAGGAVLGIAQGAALGAVASDADIAKLAATAELLAIDFYTRAIASKQLKGDELSYLVGAKENEVAHYDALKGVLKSADPCRAQVHLSIRFLRLALEHRQARRGARDRLRRARTWVRWGRCRATR